MEELNRLYKIRDGVRTFSSELAEMMPSATAPVKEIIKQYTPKRFFGEGDSSEQLISKIDRLYSESGGYSSGRDFSKTRRVEIPEAFLARTTRSARI